MSTEEQNVPKRRSSAARRRRSRAEGTQVAPAQATDQVSQATDSSEAVEVVDRNAQRREERKAAKAKSEKKGVARVVDAERFSGVRKFYNDTMSEIRKVIWPDREQTRNLTLLVIALSIVAGALLGGIDWVLLQVFENVI